MRPKEPRSTPTPVPRCADPPLTFLQPTGRKQTVTIDGALGTSIRRQSSGPIGRNVLPAEGTSAPDAASDANTELKFTIIELVPHYPS